MFCVYVTLVLVLRIGRLPVTHLSIDSHAANASALKVTCELLRIFITGSSILKEGTLMLGCTYSIISSYWENLSVGVEAVQRAADIAEAEGVSQIETTHLESILPQLLLDF